MSGKGSNNGLTVTNSPCVLVLFKRVLDPQELCLSRNFKTVEAKKALYLSRESRRKSEVRSSKLQGLINQAHVESQRL